MRYFVGWPSLIVVGLLCVIVRVCLFVLLLVGWYICYVLVLCIIFGWS